MSKRIDQLNETEFNGHDIRVIFFDIDGTLLGLEGDYTEATKHQIQRVQSLGVRTAIASGRPMFAAKHIAQSLGLNDVGVFCTGAHLQSPIESSAMHVSPLANEDARAITEFCRKTSIHYEIYTNDAYLVEKSNLPTLQRTHAAHMRQDPLIELFDPYLADSNIIKMLVAVEDPAELPVIQELEKSFSHLQFAYASIAAYPDWSFASIIDGKACKHKAFDRLCDYYGVSADNVMSFGDAHSDKVFLERAKFGISMGNAKDDVKEVASFTTLPVWEDGVAYALSKFFPEK